MAFGAVARHWRVWKAAWQAESSRSLGNATVGARATEFLPSILEIQEEPASPIGRAVFWTVVTAFVAGALWTTLGKVDIVVTAQGRLVPSGYSKAIRADEAGVIASIHVQDGQAVKQGDVLIELDSALNVADRARTVNEYRAANVEAARLQALLQDRATFEAPTDADEAYVLAQRQLLRDQLAEYHADLSAARRLIEQRRAVVRRTNARLRRAQATTPMETERAEADKQQIEEGALSNKGVLQAEERQIDQAQELAGYKKKLKQDRAALAEAENNYRAMVSEFQRTKQTELSAVETKAASLAQAVTNADQKAGLQRLVSPIDGVVRQLAVRTVGGVVTPAQQLLIVVPKDAPVEVEVQVAHKDKEFVRQGQPVEIAVETFQLARYGTISGKVLTVSADAVPVEQAGLVYPARVSLDRGFIQIKGKPVDLSPGMAVTVEIKTGQRRILESMLSPLLTFMRNA